MLYIIVSIKKLVKENQENLQIIEPKRRNHTICSPEKLFGLFLPRRALLA